MKKLPIWYDLEKHLMTEMGDALEGEFGSLDEVMAFLEKYPALYDSFLGSMEKH